MKTKKKLEKIKKEKANIKKISKKVKEKKSSREQQRFFLSLIEKSGIDADFSKINKTIIYLTFSPIFLVTIFLLIRFKLDSTYFSDALGFLLPLWTLGSIALFLILWAAFFIYVDYRIYKRKKEIEKVFPDYLQLVAANINAGMPVDKSLWFAIRPRFGILAKEMEEVAKATMVGKRLSEALIAFSKKYDSVTIERALNLLLEGMESGSEMGDLLSRVATNMRETEIIKKEMAANVTTYVIFILFATIGVAPFLFGLTTELIVIMTNIFSNMNFGESSSNFGGMASMFSNSGTTISLRDYQIFAIASIIMSSIFASIIISIIQKGNAREALKKIPIYSLIGIIIYFISFSVLSLLLGGMFQ